MGPDEILPQIRKSVVRVTVDDEEIRGIIFACKTSSAYVIADATDYSEDSSVVVRFPNGGMALPDDTECYIHNGILGISCKLMAAPEFDPDVVRQVDVCKDDAYMCEKVYVYEGMFETLTEGYAMKIDAHHYKLTNLAGDYSQYGAPVVKEDGSLVGFCCSFEHSLTAKNITSVADSIERSHNRNFVCLADTLSYLHSII